MTRTHPIKKDEIDVTKSPNGHYFLEIHNEHYEVFRAFDSREELLKSLKSYPIENKSKIIAEIKRLDK